MRAVAERQDVARLPRHVEFTIHERRSPMVAYGVVELSADAAPHVTTFALEEANRALQALKHGGTRGTGVLVVGAA